MPTYSPGRITEIVERDDGRISLLVDIEGRNERAIAYPKLCGDLREGDTVILNTTAVRLGLGTGDVHFVLWKVGADVKADMAAPDSAGHIMKLRYTPLQHNVLSVEEEASPHHHIFQEARSLESMPVIACALHSHLEPAAVMLAAGSSEKLRVAYIMTESAALPIAFSHTVARLRSHGLIDATITVGNAFGGDYEAVSVHSALIAARHVVKADVAIVAMGPGITGTGTLLGFSGFEQGVVSDAASALGGRSIFVPRVSVADLRERHRGISHHTLTCLALSLHRPATMIIPALTGEVAGLVEAQLARAEVSSAISIEYRDGSKTAATLAEFGLRPRSMGRDITEDPAFFEAAGAAGLYAAELPAIL